MYEQMMLRAQFVDRAGRMVYVATPVRIVEPEGRNDERRMEEGAPFAQVRMKPGEDGSAEVEWMELPQASEIPLSPGVKPGDDFLPGVEGPHGGGTG